MIPAEMIKDHVTIPMLLEHYGVKLNRSGRCACPIHNGHDANMAVKDRSFKCFVCGASGTVIDLQMALSGHTLDRAVKDINAMFGLGLARNRRSDCLRTASLVKDRIKKRQDKDRIRRWNAAQYDMAARARRLKWQRGGDVAGIDGAFDGLDFDRPIPSAAVLAVNHGLVDELVEVVFDVEQPADTGQAAPG